MTDRLEIRLLGPFDVLVGGRPADVSGTKRHALLAVLALRVGRVVGVEGLIEALWGEELPAAPRNAIQHHVARLRAALGRESIVASPQGYALEDATVDALRFEELLGEARVALREGDARVAADAAALALGLWRGPPLHGLTDTPWFSAEARRLEALRVDALEEQFEAALALGDHREIVPALRAALEEHPFRERVWGHLMLALYRSGRQAEALEAFHEARRMLSEELGLEPSLELRRVQEAILTHDPAIAPVPVGWTRRGNLPAASTSFVDREEEVADVVELLREHRLVTLTGPPGVGKSRLALEAVRSLGSEIRDGVWLVDLSRAAGVEDVPRLVAQAVDARGRDPLARAVARLRDADAILVLDGCGRHVTEAARIAAAVLAECPGVRVLATSRAVLHVPGEVRVTVQPLALPDPAATNVLSPAVQLFVERARAARPRFELTAETTSLVAEISRQVDGLPLAIELAAARADVLGLAELLGLVERRTALLRERPASDATLTALATLVEWSYDLLHADEKTLLHQLAAHRGGARLRSLIAVGASHGLDEATVTYLLGALVDKSIVFVSFPDGDARYELLDTIRDYALERLAESGGLERARKAHADYFAGLADEARSGLRGRDWQAWVARLELERDNLWAALAYARDSPDPAVALRLGAALGWYFALARRVSEGRRFLAFALAAADDEPPELRIELLAHLCYLETEELDLDAAIATGKQAAELATRRAPAAVGLAQAALALAVAQSGDQEGAAALAEHARAALEPGGDVWARAATSLLRAQVAALAGDISTVAAMASEAYRHAAAIEFDAFEVPAALLEAWVAERRGEGAAARDAYRRALDVAARTGFADHAAFALAGLGSNALARGDVRHAEELERRALAAAEAAGAPWAAAHARVELGRVLAAAGDVATAERLYRNVVEWAEKPRMHEHRESLFVALEDDPAAAALHGLAELADARGDGDAAEDLRGRAGLTVA